MLPYFAQARRQHGVGHVCKPLNQFDGPATEGEFDAPLRSKEVGNAWPRRTLDVLKEYGWAASRDDSAVNLRGFQIWINLRVNLY